MKRIIFIALLLAPLFNSTMAQASCGAGQGSGVDVNATTKQVTYYCYDIVQPTQTELEAEARQRIEQTLVQQANANPVTQTIEPPIVVSTIADEPTVRPRIVEVNATTGVVIEREYNDAELAQWRIDRASYSAQEQAREIARSNAQTGVNTCVNWSAFEASGTQCHYESVPVSQEEIDNQYNFLFELWSPDWFENLLSWLR